MEGEGYPTFISNAAQKAVCGCGSRMLEGVTVLPALEGVTWEDTVQCSQGEETGTKVSFKWRMG